MKKIAVVEDDEYIGNMVEELLRGDGFDVLRAYSGSEALLLLGRVRPDLVLLDLMLPGASGEAVLESAKTDVGGKVKNLNAGASDYITKPFEPDELLARVRVQLRGGGKGGTLALGGIVLDTETYEVAAKGTPVRLTKTEFAILRAFMENPKKVFSKSAVLDYIENFVPDGEESSVSVHISNLRRKLEDASGENYIDTVWGIGFRFAKDKAEGAS